MRRPRFSRFLVFVAAGVTAAGVAACSSGSTSSTAASGTASGSGLEKTTVTVDVTDSPDAGPLWIAQNDGLFKQQGLTVNIKYVPGTAAAFPDQAAHTVDFAEQNYVSFFSENQMKPQLGLRIIAPDEQAAPNTNVIMVPKDSPIKTAADLKGKKVAFPSPGINLSNLGVEEQFQGYGINPPTDFNNVTVGFPNMMAALKNGTVDAAFAIPPFITVMETQIGAHQLVDLMTGPLNNIPSTGWTTTTYEEQHYPKTVAAFQRAVMQAQQVAASKPNLVRSLLPTKVQNMTAKLANIIAMQTYMPALSETSIQRVANVMEQFGALKTKVNVAYLITAPPAAGT
jgi:NitT/TauT family transport system substrate-binding protein